MHYTSVLTAARTTIYTKVERAFAGLMVESRIVPELLETDKDGVWSALGQLMGDRFGTSILAHYRLRAANALTATPIAMDPHAVLVKVTIHIT